MSTTYANMGIKSWNSSSDFFSYTDLDSNWSKIDAHDHTSGKGVQVPTGGIADNAITAPKIASAVVDNSKIAAAAGIVGTKLAANTITNDKIATADLQKLGLSDSVVRRGKAVFTATDTRAVNTYAVLSNADRVSNIVLPTDGLIFIQYGAQWSASATMTAGAAIFLHNGTTDNQATFAISGTASPAVQELSSNFSGVNGVFFPISSSPIGMVGQTNYTTGTTYAGNSTTGQILGLNNGTTSYGGPTVIEAAAGTYAVSIQYRALGGTISVKNRILKIWTMGF